MLLIHSDHRTRYTYTLVRRHRDPGRRAFSTPPELRVNPEFRPQNIWYLQFLASGYQAPPNSALRTRQTEVEMKVTRARGTMSDRSSTPALQHQASVDAQ